jgi:hypothetical protein
VSAPFSPLVTPRSLPLLWGLLLWSTAGAAQTPADIYKKIQPALDYLLLTETTKVVWTLTPPVAASYEVYARWTARPENTAAAVYTVYHDGGFTNVTKDQQTSGGQWVSLGTFNLTPNENHRVEVRAGASGQVIADAVRISSPNTMVQGTIVHNVFSDHLDTPRLVTWNSPIFPDNPVRCTGLRTAAQTLPG